MSKGLKQKQWLNIIIIVISGLILAFTLIGRFMNSAVDEYEVREKARNLAAEEEQITRQSLQLKTIDFGFLRITNKANTAANPEWVAEPRELISTETAESLVAQWQQILNKPAKPSEQNEHSEYLSGATVLLFFTETAQPVIAKVDLLKGQPVSSNLKVTFVSTGQTIIINNSQLKQLIPSQQQPTHQ